MCRRKLRASPILARQGFDILTSEMHSGTEQVNISLPQLLLFGFFA
jgi:hypothetical protein